METQIVLEVLWELENHAQAVQQPGIFLDSLLQIRRFPETFDQMAKILVSPGYFGEIPEFHQLMA